MASPLTALSPLDGRYARSADPLRPYFSEHALIRYRLRVELAWLAALAAEPAIAELQPFSRATAASLKGLILKFDENDSKRIKEIEAETNHDVKALEYWLKARLARNREAQGALEFIHFAATSEDINNLAYALMLAESRRKAMLPRLDELTGALRALARRHASLPMLARTHGQPASPTTLGKELANVAARLARAAADFDAVQPAGKMNGAVGNWNAHVVAY
ncbi:MAG TPA: lyase family protein, partial [Burkholderiales bacterium]|nr:lyase family protein [Burkholderiales bacterium]